MIGTNNIDDIHKGTCTLNSAAQDVSDLLHKLWLIFGDTKLNIINVLPRENASKNNLVQQLNYKIKTVCETHGLTYINTESFDKHYFTYPNGRRRNDLFSDGYDNVHLNENGYNTLARYLKYLAHLW